MTKLSVNLNKIALLRNSRGRDYPNVVGYAKRFVDFGVNGITIHPRQDERHATRGDAYDLGKLCNGFDEVEFNIEGYPSEDFVNMVVEIKPDQCTLVPDDVNQLTSDHGWDVENSTDVLIPVLEQLNRAGIRSSLFIDPDPIYVEQSKKAGADRVELYTEKYANDWGTGKQNATWGKYQKTAIAAQQAGLGVNAGHDLDLNNLARFLEIPDILEVSIGHALTIESLDMGMETVTKKYLEICDIPHPTGCLPKVR